jgi:hypothetical protein
MYLGTDADRGLRSMRRRLARGALHRRGWRLHRDLPDLPKYLILLAPHICYCDWPWEGWARRGSG